MVMSRWLAGDAVRYGIAQKLAALVVGTAGCLVGLSFLGMGGFKTDMAIACIAILLGAYLADEGRTV
jgi:hypothetical protein